MPDPAPDYGLSNIGVDIYQALRQQYLGLPADAEAGRMVRRTFFIPKDLEPFVNKIIQDPRTEYESFSDLALHGFMSLLNAFQKAGYPDVEMGAELKFEETVRKEASMARRRQELRDNIHHFDDGLDRARVERDWDYILNHLTMLEEWIRQAPTTGERQALRQEVARSLAVQRAVSGLCRWVDEQVGKEDVGVSTLMKTKAWGWRSALEEWQAI